MTSPEKQEILEVFKILCFYYHLLSLIHTVIMASIKKKSWPVNTIQFVYPLF